jgi:hypothetical protein
MEGLGIALWILGGMFAAPLYCLALVKLIRPRPNLSRLFFYPAIVGLCLFILDLLLVGIIGAVHSREFIGSAFFPIHAIVTLLAASFLAGTLLLGRRSLARRWLLVAVVSWILGVFAIFFQYNVAESLYGVDGVGGPFSETN